MSEILQLSAAEIVRRIKARELSPVAVVDAHIERIERVNPLINAVVTPMFDSAREAAQSAQGRLDAGDDDLPPLFGLPVTIKDCWGVEGVRFTGGSWYHREDVAEADAPAVKQLRDAGAIILGKTNLPDMCWSGESVNPIFGRTNNPRNLNYTAGGSSGGEGAIIAAGGSPLGWGSDIAGSVRVPAAATGIVSLKPSAGRVNSGGHRPEPPELLQSFNTGGPMARRVEDLHLALSVLSETPVTPLEDIDISGRRLLVYIHNGKVPVRAPVVEAVSLAAGTLKTAGMEMIRDDDLPLEAIMWAYFALMREHGNAGFKKALGGGTPYRLLDEIKAILRGEGKITPQVLYFTQSVDLFGMVGKLLGHGSFGKLEQATVKLLNAMGEGGVLLTPTFVGRVPRHGWVWRLPADLTYTPIFNAAGFPVAVVPVGWDERGLPLAVQVVARPGEDEVALAVAQQLESAFGGWKMAEPAR